jgi:hypothetical protein
MGMNPLVTAALNGDVDSGRHAAARFRSPRASSVLSFSNRGCVAHTRGISVSSVSPPAFDQVGADKAVSAVMRKIHELSVGFAVR